MPFAPLETTRRYRPGQMLHGFEVVRTAPLETMRLAALEFRHPASGARLLHLAADDAENLFAIAFRTPPPDDTGLPHILEHSVLCGSRRYPVKDPFVELLKTSLATFLNAFTMPDHTAYPCASMNRRDFHNLMRVYADAVFFPVLSEDHFLQEGRHLEFPADGRPEIKGVVYNEMRGVYSDPDNILERHIQRLLFASNAYGRDYGGDPRAIPSLTYRQYLDFHKNYYHPANARIFTYGDAEVEQTLAILDQEYLRQFTAIAPDTTIRPLERWSEPRRAEFPYPLDPGDSPRGKTTLSLSFAANDLRDSLESLAMTAVEIYLLDNAASPLRKALIDSRLGEELGSSQYYDHQRDTYFNIILKGSEPDRADAMEALCLDVVRRECENGFNPEMVESALRFLELSAREIRPMYPNRLLERVLSAWLYDADPLENLKIGERLTALRAAMAADGRFLEKTARKWLVDNPHRLRLVLVPDTDFMARIDRETAAAADSLVAALSPAERRDAEEAAVRLEKTQSEGNSPEALATLPRLALTDVSPEPQRLECEMETVGGRDFLRAPMHAGGVGYFNLCLRLGGIGPEELDLLPLLCEAIGKGGAAGLDYATMAAREAASTGALEFSAGLVQHVEGPDRAGLKLGVWMKALDADWEKALAVLSDRLFRAEFGDRERLRDIILQSRSAWRDQIVPAGNAYAALYAARNLNPALAAAERLAGCGQARFVDRLASEIDGKLDALPERLRALRDKLLAGASPALAVIGDDAGVGLCRQWLENNAERFGGDGAPVPLPPAAASNDGGPVRIGLAAPADVAFVARAMPGPCLADADAPALLLLGVQLSFGYLWNEVRVKGGAYGVRAGLDGARGVFNFTSFRDPNIGRTLDVFTGAGEFIEKEMDLSPAGLEQAIIGAFKTLDQPMRPPSAAAAVLARRLGGETDAFRRDFRARLLSLDAERVRGAAARLFAGMAAAPVCVLSSREKITAENKRAGGVPLVVEPLWNGGGE